MIEFNSDGSIKIPGRYAEYQKKQELKLKKERCIHIKKAVVDFKPKKCILHLKLSEVFKDNKFVYSMFTYFKERAEVPSKLIKISEREFDVEIGSDFRRCSDCQSFVRRIREYLDGNIIEDKGSCTLKERNFCYEDYFD